MTYPSPTEAVLPPLPPLPVPSTSIAYRLRDMGEVDATPRTPLSTGLELGEGIEWEASLFASLITASLLDESVEKDLVLEAASIFHETVILNLVGLVEGNAASLLEGPIVDIIELADCVGGDIIAEALNWAYDVLTGREAGAEPEGLSILADCLGWGEDPDHLTPSLKASLVIVSLTASLNKYLAKIA